jgi:hypothetical protein
MTERLTIDDFIWRLPLIVAGAIIGAQFPNQAQFANHKIVPWMTRRQSLRFRQITAMAPADAGENREAGPRNYPASIVGASGTTRGNFSRSMLSRIQSFCCCDRRGRSALISRFRLGDASPQELSLISSLRGTPQLHSITTNLAAAVYITDLTNRFPWDFGRPHPRPPASGGLNDALKGVWRIAGISAMIAASSAGEGDAQQTLDAQTQGAQASEV